MVVMAYRTHDRLADYGFSIEFQSDVGWRAYVVFLPYQRSNKNSRLPYLSVDRWGRRYVDWSGDIKSLGEARTVAELWAEIAEGYQRFSAQSVAASDTEEAVTVQRLRADAA